MKKTLLVFGLLFLISLFSGCDQNDSSTASSQNDDTFAQNFGAVVSKDFIGQVVNTANNPVEGATITIGTSTVQTDSNGVFIIKNANVHERFAYVTATKAGYVDGSRAMVPTSGTNNVKIMLLPNTPTATIQSGTTSEVDLPNGTKVSFDGEFQDENGTAYSGTVSVALFHLLPSDENIDKLMPGMLYAQTKTNDEAILETFGMLNVELRGSAGQKLNIKEGHTAEITLKIDESQTATAPNSIPLWHFDEAKGYWKEDGVATKVGSNYVGHVSHFSWWNCDTFSSVVNLTVTVVDTNGNPISGVGVSLILNGTNLVSSIILTDNNGQVSGIIPANQSITLNVNAQCGIIYSTNIGPFTTNTILPDIVIASNSQINFTSITGKLVKCDNSNVTNGYILYNSSDLYPITNGDFIFNKVYCNTNLNFTLKGVDYEDLQQTELITYNYSPTSTQIGNLPTCNSIDEFISFKVNNDPTQYIYENIETQNLVGYNNGFYIYDFNISAEQGQSLFYINSDNSQIGSYSLGDNNFQFTFSKIIGSYSSTLGLHSPNNNGGTLSMNLNINKLDTVGGFIDITFSGRGMEQTGQEVTIIGIAHVRRDH